MFHIWLTSKDTFKLKCKAIQGATWEGLKSRMWLLIPQGLNFSVLGTDFSLEENNHSFHALTIEKQQIYKLTARHRVPRCELVDLLFLKKRKEKSVQVFEYYRFYECLPNASSINPVVLNFFISRTHPKSNEFEKYIWKDLHNC